MIQKLRKAYTIFKNDGLKCIINSEGLFFEVPSNSSHGSIHKVKIDHEGRAKCACKDYKFRSERSTGSYQCIHILRSLFALSHENELFQMINEKYDEKNMRKSGGCHGS